jgi:hypothetical protein
MSQFNYFHTTSDARFKKIAPGVGKFYVRRVYRVDGPYARYCGWALRAIRALHGVGRPVVAAVRSWWKPSWWTEPAPRVTPRVERPTLVEIVGAVGPKPLIVVAPDLGKTITAALTKYGSQRKAAAALGISLGMLQRRLKSSRGQ